MMKTALSILELIALLILAFVLGAVIILVLYG